MIYLLVMTKQNIKVEQIAKELSTSKIPVQISRGRINKAGKVEFKRLAKIPIEDVSFPGDLDLVVKEILNYQTVF